MIAEVAEQDKLLRQAEDALRTDTPLQEVRSWARSGCGLRSRHFGRRSRPNFKLNELFGGQNVPGMACACHA